MKKITLNFNNKLSSKDGFTTVELPLEIIDHKFEKVGIQEVQ